MRTMRVMTKHITHRTAFLIFDAEAEFDQHVMDVAEDVLGDRVEREVRPFKAVA